MKGFVYATTLVLYALIVQFAHADLRIKKLVIENCTEAKAQLPTLTPEERKELVQFLGMVFKLQGSVTPDRITQPRPAGPFDSNFDPNTQNVWRIFDPKHEEDAKHCAAEILISFRAEGFPALSQAIELLKVQGLSTQLYDFVFDASVVIPRSVVESKVHIDDAELSKFVPFLFGTEDQRTAAENVLLIFGERAIPMTVAELWLRQGNDARKVREVLLLFKDRQSVGMSVLPLLDSVEIGPRIQAIEVLSSIPEFRDQAYPILLKLLLDQSPEVRAEASEGLQKLGHAEEVSSVIQRDLLQSISKSTETLEIEQIGRILTNMTFTPGQLDAFSTVLCEPSKTSLIKIYLELLLKISEVKPNFVVCAQKALVHQDDSVVERAIKVLSHFKVPYKDTKKGIASLIDRMKGSVLPTRVSVASEILQYVERNGAVEQLVPLMPLLIEFIGEDSLGLQGALEKSLLKLNEKVVPILTKVISTSSLERAVFALNVLSKIPSKLVKFPQIITSFASRAGSKGALIKILPLVEANRAEIQKIIKTKGKKLDPGLLYLTAFLGFADEKALKTLQIDLGKYSCHAQIVLSKVLPKKEFLDAAQRCIVTAPFETLTNIPPVGLPLPGVYVSSVLQTLVKGSTDKLTIFLGLLDRWKEFGFKEDEVIASLGEILPGVPNTYRLAIIEQLLKFQSLPDQVLNGVKQLAENNQIEAPVRFRAARLLLRINAPGFNTKNYFIDALKSQERSWLEDVILEHPGWFQEILSIALQDFDGPDKAFVIHIIGQSGTIGQQYVGQLMPLADSRVRPVRDNAVVALLKLGHGEPQSIHALSRVLTQPVRRQLLKDCALLSWVKSGEPAYLSQKIALPCTAQS